MVKVTNNVIGYMGSDVSNQGGVVGVVRGRVTSGGEVGVV